jgi:hypothetical protein
MTRFISAILATGLVLGLGRLALADDDQDAKAVVDKAVKALGGAQKLGAVKAFAWKAKGKHKINDNDGGFTSKVTLQGIDHFRQEFDGDFGGNQVKGVIVLDGDKGWRKFGENSGKLEDDALANQKRNVYLQAVPAMVLPLKGEGFKVESAAEEKVGGKPAVALKVTGPDGKEFQLFFDKQSGLPVKLTATVAGFQGGEYAQETTFANYKDFDGIKRATKIETKRNGKQFIEQEITEFKVLDKVDPKTFAEPMAD